MKRRGPDPETGPFGQELSVIGDDNHVSARRLRHGARGQGDPAEERRHRSDVVHKERIPLLARIGNRFGGEAPGRPQPLTARHAGTMPGERVESAFIVGNPRASIFQCHILERQAAGMMGTVRVVEEDRVFSWCDAVPPGRKEGNPMTDRMMDVGGGAHQLSRLEVVAGCEER
jgi:hypothetical protein